MHLRSTSLRLNFRDRMGPTPRHAGSTPAGGRTPVHYYKTVNPCDNGSVGGLITLATNIIGVWFLIRRRACWGDLKIFFAFTLLEHHTVLQTLQDATLLFKARALVNNANYESPRENGSSRAELCTEPI